MKSVQIRSFFWSIFPVFGLNAEIYSLNIRIQSKYVKIRTRKNSVLGHFSCSEYFGYSCKCGNLSAEISFWFLDLHYHMLQNMSCDKNFSVCRSNDAKQTHQSVSESFVFKLVKVPQHVTVKLIYKLIPKCFHQFIFLVMKQEGGLPN